MARGQDAFPPKGVNLGSFEANDSNTGEMVMRFCTISIRTPRGPSLPGPKSLVAANLIKGWPCAMRGRECNGLLYRWIQWAGGLPGLIMAYRHPLVCGLETTRSGKVQGLLCFYHCLCACCFSFRLVAALPIYGFF
jgi:hypothetical protein